MVAVLQAHPTPPQAARALRETEAAVRNLASAAAVIALALPESGVRDGHEETDLNPPVSIVKHFGSVAKINRFARANAT